jgi:hypothetical protein
MLRELPQKEKMRFLRKLFGYTIKKGEKCYKQNGILENIGGTKLSSNTILVPKEKSGDIRKVLNEFKLKRKIKDVWIK